MKILLFVIGPLETNCYFLIDEKNQKLVIIDPGAEDTSLIREIEKIKIKPEGIINTHGHSDHTGGNSGLKKRYNIPIYIHKDDVLMLKDPIKNLSFFTNKKIDIFYEPDILIKDGDIFTFGDIVLKVIHTPGHTPGSICLLCNDAYLFSGDTLFSGDIGRTDLPGGDEKLILNSLKILKRLNKNIIVYPGHGPETRIGEEIKNNPYMIS